MAYRIAVVDDEPILLEKICLLSKKNSGAARLRL